MNIVRRFAIITVLVAAGAPVWAEEGHDAHHAEPAPNVQGEQTLTGEVVDAFCYLSHGKEALEKGHAGCATKCISSGLPVAIKVGDRLYLAAMANHEPANKTLAALAGQQVVVHGTILEGDGQHLISITSVERAK